MRLTRRNTIIGLGTLAAGAGVIGGSGAFDQVQAERDFAVGVTDDSSALLKLEDNNGSEISRTATSDSANGNTVLEIAPTGEDLNDEAVTIFEDAFFVTNNGDETVNLSASFLDSSGGEVSTPGVEFTVGDTAGVSDSTPATNDLLTGDGNSVQLTTGDRIGVSIKIDTGRDELSGTYQPGNIEDVLFDASSGDAT